MTRVTPADLTRFTGSPPSTELLKSLAYLEGLPFDEVAGLLQPNSLVVDFAAGDELTRQDDAAEFLFFVLRGTVRVMRRDIDANGSGNEERLARLVGTGGIIGRYELTFSLKCISTATAEDAVTALRWSSCSTAILRPISRPRTRRSSTVCALCRCLPMSTWSYWGLWPRRSAAGRCRQAQSFTRRTRHPIRFS